MCHKYMYGSEEIEDEARNSLDRIFILVCFIIICAVNNMTPSGCVYMYSAVKHLSSGHHSIIFCWNLESCKPRTISIQIAKKLIPEHLLQSVSLYVTRYQIYLKITFMALHL